MTAWATCAREETPSFEKALDRCFSTVFAQVRRGGDLAIRHRVGNQLGDLYRGAVDGRYAVVGNVEGAWVVLPDRSQRGATTGWTDPEPQPVTQVNAAPKLKSGATSVSVGAARVRVRVD